MQRRTRSIGRSEKYHWRIGADMSIPAGVDDPEMYVYLLQDGDERIDEMQALPFGDIVSETSTAGKAYIELCPSQHTDVDWEVSLDVYGDDGWAGWDTVLAGQLSLDPGDVLWFDCRPPELTVDVDSQ